MFIQYISKFIQIIIYLCIKTQKCSKQNKKRMAEQKRYLKEEKKQCSKIVDDYEYYDCTVKLYEKSKYKKLFDKWVKTKCSKELEELQKL
jgi:hypothetical protein